MARTIEQIEADMQALEQERQKLLADHIKAEKMKAIAALEELERLNALPPKVRSALEAKDKTINLRRTFAIRG